MAVYWENHQKLWKMTISREFSDEQLTFFHSYVSLPEGAPITRVEKGASLATRDMSFLGLQTIDLQLDVFTRLEKGDITTATVIYSYNDRGYNYSYIWINSHDRCF